MTFRIDKSAITQQMMAALSPEQQVNYREIILRRRNLYLTGFALGIVLSILVMMMRGQTREGYGWQDACLVTAILFLTSYFYYMLSEKPQLLVVELQDEAQRKKWAEVYRVMSTTYHTGLLLGVLAVVLLFRGVLIHA
jgi:hypothetical protein